MEKLCKIIWIKNKNLYLRNGWRQWSKEAKDTKKCVIKRKRAIENYKNYLEATKLESKSKNLEKNKIDVNGL